MAATDAPGRAPQVAVIGGSARDPELAALAEEVGGLLAAEGVTVICGGLTGVMEAVSRGAREAGGIVIGVIPDEDPAQANPWCTHVVATGVGHARNLAVVASADVVIAIGGEWGTLSEIAFARQVGRPVVALQSWSVRGRGAMEEAPGVTVASDPRAAIAAALEALP